MPQTDHDFGQIGPHVTWYGPLREVLACIHANLVRTTRHLAVYIHNLSGVHSQQHYTRLLFETHFFGQVHNSSRARFTSMLCSRTRRTTSGLTHDTQCHYQPTATTTTTLHCHTDHHDNNAVPDYDVSVTMTTRTMGRRRVVTAAGGLRP